MKEIYLDHAATTPMHPDVIEEMTRIMTDSYGNPSSVHGIGRKAAFELETAREEIALSINSQPGEIIFNSGGTEGDNTAIIQTALKRKPFGKHIISTNSEHSAVKESIKHLQDQGFEITLIPVDKTGRVSVEDIKNALREDTVLVSIIFGNNEVGTINPIKEIGQLLAKHQALFHTDAVQVYGTETIDVKELNIDFLTISGHKINGPKGVGFLYVKNNVMTPVMIYGGDQEGKRRAGTENLPAIVGLKKAVSLLDNQKKKENKTKYLKFQNIIIKRLSESSIEFEVNQSEEYFLPNILNIWIKNVPNHILASRLDLVGFAVSTGSACKAGIVAPSPTILAMRPKNPEAASESIRISFGYGLLESDVHLFSNNLVETIKAFNDEVNVAF